jgi:hypothetical protein
MYVLHNRLVSPGVELAGCCRDHVEAAPAARHLEQVNGPVKHGCRLLDVALADVGEGQIPEDDRLRFMTTLEAARGALQDGLRLGAITEGEIAGALNPSEPVGGEKAMGGIGSPHCLEMGFGGTKGSLTVPAHAEHRVTLGLPP